MDTPCAHCGQPMVNRVSAKARFCSTDCRLAHHYAARRVAVVIARPLRHCRTCSKPIPPETDGNAIYCSPACRQASNRRVIQARRRVASEARRSDRGPCRKCGEPIPFERRAGAVFCSRECYRGKATQRWLARSPGYMRQRLYGLTPDAFDAMLADQGSRCAICGRDEPNGRGWHVDHDHTTGRVRGILCHSCNLMLGHVGDDPGLLNAAIAYLTAQPQEGS